jgi:hypothetical protein
MGLLLLPKPPQEEEEKTWAKDAHKPGVHPPRAAPRVQLFSSYAALENLSNMQSVIPTKHVIFSPTLCTSYGCNNRVVSVGMVFSELSGIVDRSFSAHTCPSMSKMVMYASSKAVCAKAMLLGKKKTKFVK